MKRIIQAVKSRGRRFANAVGSFFEKENLRKIFTFWIAEKNLEHLEVIRARELSVIVNLFPSKGKLLEIGAGTGWQAKALENKGYEVSGIDLNSSNYKENRVWPVTDYDGKKIPFENETFDIVFSSNTLEHVPHVRDFQKEILRVLKPNGIAVHVLPSGTWRFWTNITEFLKNWAISTVHGEHAPSSFKEIYYFSRKWWSKLFNETGWAIQKKKSNRLFYTGSSVMDSRLGANTRNKLSYVLGGSCNIFVLTKKK